MKLESNIAKISPNPQTVFNFLEKVENYEKLMPESIQKFKVTGEESFVFQLKGMPEIALKVQEKEAPNRIILAADGGKIPFGLRGEITATSNEETSVQLFFEGEINAMMAMMVKKPIQNFINALSQNMTKIQ